MGGRNLPTHFRTFSMACIEAKDVLDTELVFGRADFELVVGRCGRDIVGMKAPDGVAEEMLHRRDGFRECATVGDMSANF